jgi:hypothetical protein
MSYTQVGPIKLISHAANDQEDSYHAGPFAGPAVWQLSDIVHAHVLQKFKVL